MPVKWKIFLALNFILALPAFIFLILLIVQLTGKESHNSKIYIFLSISGFALAMITINSFLGILLIQRFYPDKLIPVPVKRLNLVSMILTWMVALGLLLLCIYGANEELGSANEDHDPTGKIVLAILSLALIIQVVVLVMQGQLPKLINRNNQNKMQVLIDTIGN